MQGSIFMGRNRKMPRITKYLGLLALGAASLGTASSAAPAKPGWLTTFSLTDAGAHVVGNPAAPTRVVEYLSYTCGHCAAFEANDAPKFKAQYVATGKASLEIRNYVLNAYDMTAAMLARCGGKGRFFGNQKHLLATQSTWLGRANSVSAATKAKLQAEDYHGFMVGAYAELGLGPIMQQRGVAPAQAKACLADKAALKTILDMTDAGSALGVNSTPSFLINGKLQDHMHSFAELQAALK